MIIRLRHLDNTADLNDGLDLGDQPLRRCLLANDLLGRMPGALHGEAPDSVWPAEGSHSPRAGFLRPRQ